MTAELSTQRGSLPLGNGGVDLTQQFSDARSCGPTRPPSLEEWEKIKKMKKPKETKPSKAKKDEKTGRGPPCQSLASLPPGDHEGWLPLIRGPLEEDFLHFCNNCESSRALGARLRR